MGYLVEDWGEGDPEWWFYASNGVGSSYKVGQPVQFATVLQGMLPKFTQAVSQLGFSTCRHEEGTWKVHVAWAMPTEEQIRSSMRRLNGGLARSPSPKLSRASNKRKSQEDHSPTTEAPASPQEPLAKQPRAPPGEEE